MAQHRAEDRGRHDSGQTSTNPRSGTTGKHDASNPKQQPAKDRTDTGKLTGRGEKK